MTPRTVQLPVSLNLRFAKFRPRTISHSRSRHLWMFTDDWCAVCTRFLTVLDSYIRLSKMEKKPSITMSTAGSWISILLLFVLNLSYQVDQKEYPLRVRNQLRTGSWEIQNYNRKPEGKRPFPLSKRKSDDNIKFAFK